MAFQPGQAAPRDLAAALIRHEFPSVEFPFGRDGEMPADEVLKRHGIVNVTHSLIRRDMEPAHMEPAHMEPTHMAPAREGLAQAR